MTAHDPALHDPLFAELRRRHPDVDLVMLPPVDPRPPAVPPATTGQALAVRRHAKAVVDALWSRVGRTPDSVVDVWWAQDHPLLRRYLVRSGVSRLREGEAEVLVNDVARALLDLGWEPQPSPADQPFLMARVGTFDVKVSGFATAVSVEVTSEALHLTPDALAAADTEEAS
jgi:hypothetical protein